MNKTIYNLATIAGFVVGVVSCFYTALQLFWDEHGEQLQDQFYLTFEWLKELGLDLNTFRKDTAEWYTGTVKPVVARGVDQLYFRVIDM